jgi:hypothetical protein
LLTSSSLINFECTENSAVGLIYFTASYMLLSIVVSVRATAREIECSVLKSIILATNEGDVSGYISITDLTGLRGTSNFTENTCNNGHITVSKVPYR